MLACGQTAVIIAGGMDLSVGSIVSLVSVLVASTAHPGDFPLIVPIMVGLLTGLVCGLINGLAVAKLKIPPFIVTMSTMTIFAGIALLITKGTPINHLAMRSTSSAAASCLASLPRFLCCCSWSCSAGS